MSSLDGDEAPASHGGGEDEKPMGLNG